MEPIKWQGFKKYSEPAVCASLNKLPKKYRAVSDFLQEQAARDPKVAQKVWDIATDFAHNDCIVIGCPDKEKSAALITKCQELELFPTWVNELLE